jgi:hypothetical protein
MGWMADYATVEWEAGQDAVRTALEMMGPTTDAAEVRFYATQRLVPRSGRMFDRAVADAWADYLGL